MNASEISFGIEIETTMPAGSVTVGGYHNGLQVAWLPAGWRAERDCSIRATRGRLQCEFVSPILKGAEGIKQVVAAVEAIKARGGKVNESCGIHVTITFPANDAAALEKLTLIVANFEKAIYASTGTKNRERGRYSRGIQQFGSAATARQQASASRYTVLNLTHAAQGKNRVEVRAFASSLNTIKIVGYIRMVLALAERATEKRATKFVAKTPVESSPIHRSGVGQTELTRLFYTLGWTKGRTKQVFGDVVAEGLPSHQRVKKELMAMAKKYDAQP